MDVPEIKPGGIDHRERPVEIVRPDKGGNRHHAPVEDSATISHDGRHTLKTVEELATVLRSPDADRAALVDQALARLASGELDRPEVYRAAAERILRGGE